MIAKIIDAFFGCHHSNYSFPMTVRSNKRRNVAASLTGTYVTCLNCGKEFAYDWQEMKIVGSLAAEQNRVHALATKEAA